VQAKRRPINLEDLTEAERIQLAEDLWDSVDPESLEIALTLAQAVELDERLEQLRRGPDSGESWEVVRDRLYGSLRGEE
jgi:putative addiction module component (TIGR02574 family)